MGFFLGFLVENNLLTSPYLSKKVSREFMERKILPGALCKALGGQVSSYMMSNVGIDFCYYYYIHDDEDLAPLCEIDYVTEYPIIFAEELSKLPSQFHLPDNWKNYEKARAFIQRRFLEWKNQGSTKPTIKFSRPMSADDLRKAIHFLQKQLRVSDDLSNLAIITVSDLPRAYWFEILFDRTHYKQSMKQFYENEKSIRAFIQAFTDKHIDFQFSNKPDPAIKTPALKLDTPETSGEAQNKEAIENLREEAYYIFVPVRGFTRSKQGLVPGSVEI